MIRKFRKTEFTEAQIKHILDEAKFPEGLKTKDVLTIQWWLFFNRYKFNIFVSKIKDGMQIQYAFKEASKNKKNKYLKKVATIRS